MSLSEDIPIMPYPISTAVDHIKIYVDNFQLNAIDCWCSVYEYDVSDKLLNVHRVYIEPELYAEWGTVDQYIVDIVLDKLGYERKREPVIQF
jgi:hypothetical protein